MLDNVIQSIQSFLLSVFGDGRIVTLLIATIPIVEARLAIPIGFSFLLSPFEAWGYSFLGSTMIAPLLLLVLIPLIKWLMSTRIMRKAATYIYNKFESKASKIGSKDTTSNENKRYWNKSDVKKMLGVLTFVAIPLPMTGVWTGCAVAGLIGLSYSKSLISIVLGNLIASLLILMLTVLFEPYINTIILILAIIAVVFVLILILKIILHKENKELATEKATMENILTDEITSKTNVSADDITAKTNVSVDDSGAILDEAKTTHDTDNNINSDKK